jgi:hypothetical protein
VCWLLVNVKGKVGGRTRYSCQKTIQDTIDTRSMTILEVYQSIYQYSYLKDIPPGRAGSRERSERKGTYT